ncbi:hypothetical protein PVAP13_7KG089009, partial [Panicum virgatum]
MAARRHTLSMQDLPMEVAVQIAGHLAVRLVSPMDDRRSLRVTCRFLRGVTSDRTVGQCIDVRRFAAAMLPNDRDGYAALLAHLTDIGLLSRRKVLLGRRREARPCIVELARAAERGNNVAAYVADILLFRANTGADDDKAGRWYMCQVEGEEEVAARVAGGTG